MGWTKKDERFKYLKKENGGLSSARNAGIKLAKGQYILPLDADDKISESYLTEASLVLDNRKDISIVYCKAAFFGEKSGTWDLPDFTEAKMLTANLIFCTALFRRKDFLETPGYNANMIYGWEDWDLWLSFLERGKKVFKLPDVHFYYRIKKNNSMLKDLEDSMIKKRDSLRTIYLNHLNYLKPTAFLEIIQVIVCCVRD